MNLAERGELVGFLRRHGLSPDKSLGQHFLCSAKVTNSITGAVGDVATVLEIGPGPGTLTQALAKRWPTIAIEKDERMLPLLRESAPGAEVHIEDVLVASLTEICRQLLKPLAVVSNMPYNITGPLLARVAECSQEWTVAVLMMQREVGHKILAKPGNRNRGAISVRLQAEFEITKVCDVPAGAFLPPPNVESVVLKLRPREFRLGQPIADFVHKGFAQPRKTLANNLMSAGYSRQVVEAAGLDPLIRPHELTQDEWLRLFECREG